MTCPSGISSPFCWSSRQPPPPSGRDRRTVRARHESPVAYAEFPAAGHNFDLFASLRNAAVTTAVLEFTAWLLDRRAA